MLVDPESWKVVEGRRKEVNVVCVDANRGETSWKVEGCGGRMWWMMMMVSTTRHSAELGRRAPWE